MRKLAVAFVVMLGLAATATAAEKGLETALKLAPENMGIVVAIPDVQKMVDSAQTFAKAIGVPDNDLKEITAASFLNGPFTGGDFLDAAGPVVIVSNSKGDTLVVAAVKDAKGWQEKVAPTDLGGGLFEIDKGYAKAYAVIVGGLMLQGNDKLLVQAAAKGDSPVAQRFTTEAGPLYGKSTVLVYFDMKPLRPAAKAKLMSVQMVLPLLMASATQVTPGTMAMVSMLLDKVTDLTQDMQADVLGVNFDAQGVAVSSVTSFGLDSETGKFLAQIEPSNESLLRGLPASPAAIAFAYDWKLPEGTKSLTLQMLDAVLKATPNDPNNPGQREALQLVRSINAAVSGASCVISLGDDGKLVGGGYYLSDKPDVVLKGMRALSDPQVMSAYMSMFAPMGALGMKIKTEKTTLGGADVDVFHISLDPNDPKMAEGMKLIDALYGNPFQMSIAGAKTGVAFAFGGKGGTPLMEQMLKGGAEFISLPGVKSALASLPPKPAMCVLVDPVACARMGLSMAKIMGLGLPPMMLPKSEPTYGVLAAYFAKNTLQLEVRVPAACIKPLVAMANAAEQHAPASAPADEDTPAPTGGADKNKR